jgi:hypothetical protein
MLATRQFPRHQLTLHQRLALGFVQFIKAQLGGIVEGGRTGRGGEEMIDQFLLAVFAEFASEGETGAIPRQADAGRHGDAIMGTGTRQPGCRTGQQG